MQKQSVLLSKEIKMARGNKYYQELRLKLIQQFGGKCEKCEEPDTTKLHFAHKIGHRLNYGRSRGSNHRTREVQKEPGKFLLLCNLCHLQYDRENQPTEEEQRQIDNYVPF